MLNGDKDEDDLLIKPNGNLETIFQAIYFKPIYILFRLESESSHFGVSYGLILGGF